MQRRPIQPVFGVDIRAAVEQELERPEIPEAGGMVQGSGAAVVFAFDEFGILAQELFHSLELLGPYDRDQRLEPGIERFLRFLRFKLNVTPFRSLIDPGAQHSDVFRR